MYRYVWRLYGLGRHVTNAVEHEDKGYSLSDRQTEFLRQWALSNIVHSWIEKEPCCIAENAIVNIGVLYDGVGIMPLAVKDQTNSQQCGYDQQRPEPRNIPLSPVLETPRWRVHLRIPQSLRRCPDNEYESTFRRPDDTTTSTTSSSSPSARYPRCQGRICKIQTFKLLYTRIVCV